MVELKYRIIDKNTIESYAIDENGTRYKVKRIGTNKLFNSAKDLKNKVRKAKGLEEYYYEATDIPCDGENNG